GNFADPFFRAFVGSAEYVVPDGRICVASATRVLFLELLFAYHRCALGIDDFLLGYDTAEIERGRDANDRVARAEYLVEHRLAVLGQVFLDGSLQLELARADRCVRVTGIG